MEPVVCVCIGEIHKGTLPLQDLAAFVLIAVHPETEIPFERTKLRKTI